MGVFDRNEDPKDPQVVFRRQAKRIVELYGGDADRMAEEANDIGATVVRQNGHWLFTSGEWTEVVLVDPSAPKKIVVNLDAIKPVDRDMVPEKAVERILSERIARDFVTVVAGSGGVGKTSWLIATILTMSTGGALLADLPHSSGGEARHRVLYANLEDGQAMVDRLLKGCDGSPQKARQAPQSTSPLRSGEGQLLRRCRLETRTSSSWTTRQGPLR